MRTHEFIGDMLTFIATVLVANVFFLVAAAIFLPMPARADECSVNPGAPGWNNPCSAVAPPWHHDGWRATDGIPGTWGPGGYTPCQNQKGC